MTQPPPASQFTNVIAQRRPTPPSEDIEGEHSRDESGRVQESKGKNAKGKNVGWKDKEKDKEEFKDKDGKARGGDPAVINESPLGHALAKESLDLHARGKS